MCMRVTLALANALVCRSGMYTLKCPELGAGEGVLVWSSHGVLAFLLVVRMNRWSRADKEGVGSHKTHHPHLGAPRRSLQMVLDLWVDKIVFCKLVFCKLVFCTVHVASMSGTAFGF